MPRSFSSRTYLIQSKVFLKAANGLDQNPIYLTVSTILYQSVKGISLFSVGCGNTFVRKNVHQLIVFML